MKIDLGKPLTLIQGDEVAKVHIDGFERVPGGVVLSVVMQDDASESPDSGASS